MTPRKQGARQARKEAAKEIELLAMLCSVRPTTALRKLSVAIRLAVEEERKRETNSRQLCKDVNGNPIAEGDTITLWDGSFTGIVTFTRYLDDAGIAHVGFAVVGKSGYRSLDGSWRPGKGEREEKK